MKVFKTRAAGEAMCVMIALDGATVAEIRRARGSTHAAPVHGTINALQREGYVRTCGYAKGGGRRWAVTEHGQEFFSRLCRFQARRIAVEEK